MQFVPGAMRQASRVPVMAPQAQGGAGSASPRKKSKLLKVGIICCIIAILLLALAMVLVFKPFGLFEDDFEVDKPTNTQVEQAFDSVSIPEPDLAGFKYMDTSDLVQTTIGDFSASSVNYEKQGKETVAVSTGQANAFFKNDSLKVTLPLTLRLEYDRQDEMWVPGNINTGTVSATPLVAANIDEIKEDFPNILEQYNSEIAQYYVGATISSEGTLGSNGGSLIFTLTKAAEGEQPERTIKANADVSWDDSSGWQVTISNVEGDLPPSGDATEVITPEPDASEPQTPTTNPDNGNNNGSGGNGGTSSGGDKQPTMQLVCSYGEPVALWGTIVFDNSGKVLLRLDAYTRVVMGNRTYDTSYVEVLGTNFTNGAHGEIIGNLYNTGTLPNVPLVLNTNVEW